jgi:hypothetical protein
MKNAFVSFERRDDSSFCKGWVKIAMRGRLNRATPLWLRWPNFACGFLSACVWSALQSSKARWHHPAATCDAVFHEVKQRTYYTTTGGLCLRRLASPEFRSMQREFCIQQAAWLNPATPQAAARPSPQPSLHGRGSASSTRRQLISRLLQQSALARREKDRERALTLLEAEPAKPLTPRGCGSS